MTITKTLITVETNVKGSIEKVWECWNRPEHIVKWNNASDDWHTTRAQNDLRVNGQFTYRMEAKDGTKGFDFSGTYTEVTEHERIAYTLGDDRKVTITFIKQDTGVKIIERFDAENIYPVEMQKKGWQAILNNFKDYTEMISW